MTARDIGFQDQSGKAIPRGEQAGGQATEAGANDYDIIVGHTGLLSLPVQNVQGVQPLRSVQTPTSFLILTRLQIDIEKIMFM